MANTHKAWRLHAHDDLRFDEVETPKPAPDGVLVRIEAGMVLSYTGRVLSGSVPYSLPPMPFVPGTNAIARVIAAGDNVSHVRSGDRVFLSPHLRGDVPDREPPQILIGLTATVTTPAALAMQMRWRDGVFAEIAHWPAAGVTPLAGLNDKPASELIGLAKLIVPFGGLQRSGLRGGHTIIVNGATGYFGSGAVMLAVAMGAGRVVAIHNFGAGDIIEIAPPDGATLLLPFTNAVVPTVDLAGGRVVIEVPEEIEGDDPAAA